VFAHQLTIQANALAPNWGQIIFQSANEVAANTTLRERLDEIQANTEAEKEWWEKRRATIKTKELEEDAEKVTSGDEPVIVENNTPSATPAGTPSGGSKKKKGKK
jgi:translocation protein SEC66